MFWCRSEEMQHLVSETNLWLIAARHHPTRGRPVGFRYGLEVDLGILLRGVGDDREQ
jgi:hypothetical protein